MAIDPTITLNDNPARLPAELRARVVPFTAEEVAALNSGRKGVHSQVIDRNRPIEVIKGDARGVMAAHAPAPPVATNPMRRDAMDDIMGQQGVITVSEPLPQVGPRRNPANAIVIPYAPATVAKVAAVQPSAPPPPTVLPPVTTWTSTVVPQPPVPPTTEITQPAPQGLIVPMAGVSGTIQPIKRETVNLSSPTIGRHRLKVAQLLVSASIVVLVYEDNEESTIYEPPALGADHVLTVEHGAEKYDCVYHGLTVTQPMLGQPGRQLLLVVLVRV